jgi:hypothetical protein
MLVEKLWSLLAIDVRNIRDKLRIIFIIFNCVFTYKSSYRAWG